MALCFGQNQKNWPRHNLDNYIYKGTSRTDFLISLPCKCHLNYNELRAIVTLFHVTFQYRARALPYWQLIIRLGQDPNLWHFVRIIFLFTTNLRNDIRSTGLRHNTSNGRAYFPKVLNSGHRWRPQTVARDISVSRRF